MKPIPTERKEAILAKMSGPGRRPIRVIAEEEGLSVATLYTWRQQARNHGRLLPDCDETPEGWSAQDKFNAVLECAPLSENELGEYCRRRGLHTQQIRRWRESCERANDWAGTENRDQARRRREDAARIRQLESELRRKEKALAEAAALLVLKKKVLEILGEEEE